jgi:hypothetical protein
MILGPRNRVTQAAHNRAAYRARQQAVYRIIQQNERVRRQNALIALHAAQRRAVWLAVPPELGNEIATAENPTEAFLERYRRLTTDEQRTIKVRMATAILGLGEFTHSLIKQDATGCAFALLRLLLALYELKSKLENM